MEARCGGLAVVSVRQPLQPRDTNVVVASPAAALAGKAPKAKTKATKEKARGPAASSPPSVRSSYAKAGSSMVAEMEVVSLAEELEKARQRQGRLRAAREVTDRALDERSAALRWEAREWEQRADEQRRLVAELMRLIGMPEVYIPVESLRSKEERKRKEAITHSGSLDTASTLLDDVRESCCDRDFVETASESSS